MTKSAESALARTLDRLSIYSREQWRSEQDVEALRKRALRASWLDLRSHVAVRERSKAMTHYNAYLRRHLIKWHLIAPNDLPDSEWELDALHEELHGRRLR